MSHPLEEQTITAIHIHDSRHLQFVCESGLVITAVLSPGSWIEAINGAEHLIGHLVVDVDRVSVPDYGPPTYYYGCRIIAMQGFCVIDYRSNSHSDPLEWHSSDVLRTTHREQKG